MFASVGSEIFPFASIVYCLPLSNVTVIGLSPVAVAFAPFDCNSSSSSPAVTAPPLFLVFTPLYARAICSFSFPISVCSLAF